MQFLFDFFSNIFNLANAMSFYILIGLLIAGILKQIVSEDLIFKHLGKNNFKSVIKATIFGIPLPVCSCSVIPLAKSLQKEGASKGAVQSFLISTPITGVDSIMATYSFFGIFFTIYRVVTSIIIAISVGIIENLIFKPKPKPKFFLATKPLIKKASNCCSSSGCCTSKKNKKFSIKAVFNYAFNTLFSDIAKSLLIGLVIGALFTTFLPKNISNFFSDNLLISYFLVLLISMPMYVCATASLPIAAAFLINGLSPGAAFVFLTAGPATNSVTMSVVAQMFGKKSMFLYIFLIAFFSILFGAVLDFYFDNLKILQSMNHFEKSSYLDIISTIIMFGLILYYLGKSYVRLPKRK
jgi:uncharacterized membrane protein YraQ (UPF0718 family)